MPCIKKILNYSVLLVSDGTEEEYIVVQKGIGFGKKVGDEVNIQSDSQIYVPVAKSDSSKLLELLDEIPTIYLEITYKVIAYAQEQLRTSLNQHIYLTLTDHLYFAVKRFEQGILITNRILWELKTFYPKEYQIGLYTLSLIKDIVGIELPNDEAANIAFHIINAQKEKDSQFDAMRAAKLIGNVMTTVSYMIKYQPDKESIHYSRFVNHMQYFAERFFTDKMLDSDDEFLYNHIVSGYPKALNCAEKIRTLLLKEYNKLIPNEEVAYLAIHIQRLVSRKK